jgi:hypothetical protein
VSIGSGRTQAANDFREHLTPIQPQLLHGFHQNPSLCGKMRNSFASFCNGLCAPRNPPKFPQRQSGDQDSREGRKRPRAARQQFNRDLKDTAEKVREGRSTLAGDR